MPCDEEGEYLEPGQPPLPRNPNDDPADWWPYENRFSFELAELLYCKARMSITYTNLLLQLWSQITARHGELALFTNHSEMLETIDATPLAGVPWQCFDISYVGPIPEEQPHLQWMRDTHTVFFRDPRLVVQEMLANPEYEGSINYAPTQVFDKNKDRQYQDLMTGNWSWDQAVRSCSNML